MLAALVVGVLATGIYAFGFEFPTDSKTLQAVLDDLSGTHREILLREDVEEILSGPVVRLSRKTIDRARTTSVILLAVGLLSTVAAFVYLSEAQDGRKYLDNLDNLDHGSTRGNGPPSKYDRLVTLRTVEYGHEDVPPFSYSRDVSTPVADTQLAGIAARLLDHLDDCLVCQQEGVRWCDESSALRTALRSQRLRVLGRALLH